MSEKFFFLVAAGLDHDARDADIAKAAVGLCAQFYGIAMARYHAVADADILAKARRGRFQGDAVVVAIRHDASHNHLVTAVNIQSVVVIIVAIEHLDAVDSHAVAGQIVLHPAAGVPQCDVLDGDILALNETYQVRTGDALVVPRELFEGAASSVDSAEAVNHHVSDLVGINQLNGGCLRAQRHVVGLHRPVVVQVGTAVKRGALFQIEVHVRLQHHGANLILARRHYHPAASILRAFVYRLLQSLRTQYCRIRLCAIRHNIIITCRCRQHRQTQHQRQ